MSKYYRFGGEKYEIPESEIEIYKFLDKSTLIIGPSETGKTTMISHILEVLRPYVSSLFVIYPTKETRDDYKGKTPNQAIFESFHEPWLQEVRKRQTVASSIQSKSDDIKILKQLFDKVSNDSEKNNIRNIETVFEDMIDGINLNEKEKFKFTHKMGLMRKLKKTIRDRKDNICTTNLTEDQATCLKYLDFKAHTCIIFDDCSSQLKPYMMNNRNELFGDLFYRCRHLRITLIFVLHNDTIANPDYKKNAFNVIFTSKPEASAFFNRPSMYSGSSEKKQHNLAVNAIFDPKDKFQHMRYSSRINPPYYHIKADPFGFTDHMIGSKYFHKLCDRAKNDGKKQVAHNEYSALFQM